MMITTAKCALCSITLSLYELNEFQKYCIDCDKDKENLAKAKPLA
jgi:hypothetical protein